ncbi:SWIM zinc finger family protein [Desulforhopalus singaporensis]|uniref:SWIM-type domain-containing protein n=1 Tax=Desulforhopalus singaporensis TaxID=91360 RepID=A0A1H0SPU1_9BACT|nr:hypothetical protein [Desulforhopalus singaporensis]SDP43750.1 hypothetical protein SAMN05660330_02764 [Desulforhopalus singaporensis]
MGYWGFPKYVTVAEKKARALKKLEKLKKKNPGIKPVILQGKTLARNWWGKSWNKNLERYADYENRIDRGRSYVRLGAVLDLQIKREKISALVAGSAEQPYKVEISIMPITLERWKEIRQQCEGQLQSLQDLLAGKFPESLADIFFSKDKGLFPDPKAIKLDCSCPDWATMCKHVAATLYGVGARLDEDPSLFFILRGVNTNELIAKAVEDSAKKLAAKAGKKSGNVLDDADLSDIFGIDMDNVPDFSKKKAEKPSAGPNKKKSAARKKAVSGKRTNQLSRQPTVSPGNATAHVAEVITARAEGISMSELVEQTAYDKTKLYGIVHRLKKQGKIRSISHGVYGKT